MGLNALAGASVLITGGTGSFGKAFVEQALAADVKRLVVYSRDELKQFEMQMDPRFKGNQRLRFFIGDVRDSGRLHRAMEGVDTVIHAAALKQVPAAERNPFEAVKTNIIGAQNVIEAAMDQGATKVVALSTDKAAAPINLYGATKLCSDKLFVAANNFVGARKLRFSVVRYGNVMGSRGSVIPFFMREREKGVLPITSPEMTRFNITLNEGVELVASALTKMRGGEIYVPKIPSYKIMDVAKAIGPNCDHTVVGVRPGEKIHEEMITETDSLSTLEYDNHYVVCPAMPLWDMDEYAKETGGKRVERGFHYSSGNNTEWLGVEEIRSLIKECVDPNFTV